MIRGMYVLAIVAVMAMSMTACSESTRPVGPQVPVEFTGGEPNAGILGNLQNPVLNVSVRDGGLALVFSAGASGRSDDLSIVAARSIEMVRFEVFGGDGRLIDGMVTTEVPTTGVTESDVSSLTVFADVQMATIPSEPGAFARARVEARGGDVLILEAAIPQPRND